MYRLWPFLLFNQEKKEKIEKDLARKRQNHVAFASSLVLSAWKTAPLSFTPPAHDAFAPLRSLVFSIYNMSLLCVIDWAQLCPPFLVRPILLLVRF